MICIIALGDLRRGLEGIVLSDIEPSFPATLSPSHSTPTSPTSSMTPTTPTTPNARDRYEFGSLSVRSHIILVVYPNYILRATKR